MSHTLPKLSAIGRLDIGGETTFGTESSNFDYLRCMVVDPSSLTVATLRDEHMRQGDYEVARIIGAHTGTLTTSHYLHGFSSTAPAAAPSGVDSTTAGCRALQHLVAVLASGLGNYRWAGFATGAGGTVGASGAPTDSITIADAAGGLSTWLAGDPIAWLANSRYTVGWLTAIAAGADPDVGTLLQTTPRDNPAGTTAWGGAPVLWLPKSLTIDAYHSNGGGGPTDGAGGTLGAPATSWSLRLYRHDADDYVICTGCRPLGAKISFAGELALIEITWGISHWAEQGSGGAPSVGEHISAPATVYPQPEPPFTGWCSWGATASTNLLIKNLEIDFGLTRQPITDQSKSSGIGGYYTAKRSPVVSFMVYREYAAEIAYYAAQTGLPWTYQHGSQPGKMFACAMPNARVIEHPSWGDDNNASMAQVKLSPDYYDGDTGSPSAIVPADSDFRLAWI